MQLPGLRSSSLEIARSHVILHCTTTSKSPSQVSPDFACQLHSRFVITPRKSGQSLPGASSGSTLAFQFPAWVAANC